MSLSDYELLSELGRGGMGVVHRARHRATGALRAVKVSTTACDPEQLERFRREAETLARAGGDGVVPVHEAGLEQGRLSIVMGLMARGSLRDRLRARGRLDWKEAAALTALLARALERCHRVGLIHRDLKPENVLFDDDDRPRLADFGAARDLEAESLTETGTVLGTPVYMAPEQLNGEKVDARADVYALGSILHELVTGAPPCPGTSVLELLREKRAARFPSIRTADPSAPPALDALIARALAPARDARIASAADLALELEALLAGRPGRQRSFVRAALVLGGVLGAAAGFVALRSPLASLAEAPRGAPPAPLPPPVAHEAKKDWYDELRARATRESPPWFGDLSPEQRPVGLPPGIFFLDTKGEYWNEADGSVLVFRAGSDPCFLGKRQVEVRQFARYACVAADRAPTEGGGHVHVPRVAPSLLADDPLAEDADWLHPRGKGFEAGPREPVTQVTWFDAREYCIWAGGSLPTRERIRPADDAVYRWREEGILEVGPIEKPAHLERARETISTMMEWLGDVAPGAPERRLKFCPTFRLRGEYGGADLSESWGARDRRDDMGFRLCRDP
jgi:hypothetical protein